MLQLGLVTTVAVVAHEIPRELGDFAVLLDSGFTRRRALFWNVAFSVAAIAGGVLGYYSLSAAKPAIPYILALAAASFIYIAVADLVPGLHRHPQMRAAVAQSLAMACGIASMAAVDILRRIAVRQMPRGHSGYAGVRPECTYVRMRYNNRRLSRRIRALLKGREAAHDRRAPCFSARKAHGRPKLFALTFFGRKSRVGASSRDLGTLTDTP